MNAPYERLRRLARGRYGPIAVARAIDQAGMGVITLVLAARLEVGVFGTVSLLLITASLGASIADGGRALAIMRLDGADRIGSDSLRSVRRLNLVIAVVTGAVGVTLFDGPWRVVVGTAGVVWALSAEQMMGRAAMIASHEERRCAVVEVTAAVAGVAVLVALGFDHAVGALPAALVTRSAVVGLGARRALASKQSERSDVSVGSALVLSQGLAYAIANVDYAIALLVLGADQLGIYVLGFRTANLAPAQLSSAMWPVALNDLANDADVDRTYHRLLRSACWIGVLGAVVTAGASPLLPLVLGERWSDVVPVVLLLAPAIPFRLTFGLAGSALVARGHERILVRCEVLRLVGTGAALCLAATFGLGAFVAAVAAVTIIAHGLLHHVVRRLLSISGVAWRFAAFALSCETVLYVLLAPGID